MKKKLYRQEGSMFIAHDVAAAEQMFDDITRAGAAQIPAGVRAVIVDMLHRDKASSMRASTMSGGTSGTGGGSGGGAKKIEFFRLAMKLPVTDGAALEKAGFGQATTKPPWRDVVQFWVWEPGK